MLTEALQGGWAVPGAISAASIAAPLQPSTPASPLGTVVTSAPNHVASNALLPLSYWYGHAEMRRNPLLMDRLIRNLGENIRDRYENDTAEGTCGLPEEDSSAWLLMTRVQAAARGSSLTLRRPLPRALGQAVIIVSR